MKTGVKKRSGDWLSEDLERSLGFTSPRCFQRRVSASEGIVRRLDLYGKLIGHNGCVNAIEFNSTGELLVSGSDDRHVIFWDWETKRMRFSYSSGHINNVFQTKIMPFTNDQVVVTSAADGQVRLGQVSEGGAVDTKRLGRHRGQVYKLAVEPGSPHVLYSCGEDGIVQHFDLRSNSSTKLFCCNSFTQANNENQPSPSPRVRLNTIVVDPRNPNYLAVGGSDEYARVYDMRSCQCETSASLTGKPVNVFCPLHLVDSGSVHITGIAYSNKSELLVSYNDELIYLFDRNMGMGPNPLIFSREHEAEESEFDKPRAYSGHRNSETVKGVGFFGMDDEYVVSGSDCGHIFMWSKLGAKLVRVMAGDRHVVNQLEPHPAMPVLASCGIEKTAKIWMPTSADVQPFPSDLQEIIESNRKGREEPSPQLLLPPGVFMRVLRLRRRQAQRNRRNEGEGETQLRGEDEDEEETGDDEEAYVLGFPDNGANSPSEDDDPRECYIS